jgi:hypothetical protein
MPGRDVRIFPLLIAAMEEEIGHRGLDLVFGLPNELAKGSQLRAFRDFSFEAWSFIKVLDWEAYLSGRLGIRSRALLRAMKAVLGPAFDRGVPGLTHGTELRKEVPEGIEEVCREACGRSGLASMGRDTRFIRWKYVDNPVRDYTFVSSRRHGRLDGVLVYSAGGTPGTAMAEISDLVCDPRCRCGAGGS